MTLTYTRKEFNALLKERDRYRERNAELLEALKAASPVLEGMPLGVADQEYRDKHAELCEQVYQAITKAKGA